MESTPSIRTYTGKMFNLLEPDPGVIDIKDIAHALSNQCRFTGHTSTFYSVAEHSVNVSNVPLLNTKELQLIGLLHDATEAYLVDLPRPIKKFTDLGAIFKLHENHIWEAIALHFGLPLEIPEEVHEADRIVLVTEKRDLMRKGPDWDSYGQSFLDNKGGEVKPLSKVIYPLALPFQSESAYLNRYYSLTEALVGRD